MGKILPIATLAAFLALAAAGCSSAKQDSAGTPEPVPTSQTSSASFGEPAALAIGQAVRYSDGLRVQLETIDDSRCPAGVACVWEGELAPLLRLAGGSLATEQEVRLGTVRAVESTLGNYAIVLHEATTAAATIVVSAAVCRKTGCSGEICSDDEIASPCIYRPEYECYQTATCERQPDGECGWTESPALSDCLAGSPSPQAGGAQNID